MPKDNLADTLELPEYEPETVEIPEQPELTDTVKLALELYREMMKDSVLITTPEERRVVLDAAIRALDLAQSGLIKKDELELKIRQAQLAEYKELMKNKQTTKEMEEEKVKSREDILRKIRGDDE